MAIKFVSSTSLEYFYTKLKPTIDSKLDASRAYKHPTSGVTAGTYRSVTVDANGHVTAGSNFNYAGSSSAGGAANSVKTNLVVKLNGGSTEGTNLFTFNGSTAKTINITPSAIGAAASSHGRHVPDVCTTISDWNSATTTGWYMANNASNAPAASVWFYGFVIAHSTNHVRQILYRFATDNNVSGTNCDRYERVKHNGTWGSWVNTSVRVAVPSNAKFTDTTYDTGTASASGITKLYTGTGSNTDGAMTQKAITDALNGKANSSHTHSYAGSSSAGGAANSVANSITIKLNGGSTENTNLFTFNGSAAKTINITPGSIGAATSSHTHNYAGSSSAGGAANSVKTNLVVKLNGGSTEGTNLFTFNGSAAKTINITPSAIGASASGHTHNYAGSSSAGGSATSAVKLATARTINGVNFDGTANISLTANPTANQLTDQNLNDVKTPAFYYAGGSNSVTNKPSGVDPFGLIVMKNAGGYIEQIMVDSNQKIWMRKFNSTDWGAWNYSYTTLNKPSKSDVGLSNVENKSSATIRGELTKDNVTTALGYTPPTTNTTYNTGNTTTAGITKLYTGTGSNTDGAMTQKAITDALNGKANSSHTHSYAGSSSAGGAANSVANSITVKLNGGSTENTNLFTFNGSAAKTINITPSGIGAATSGHTHNYAGSSSAGGAANSVANSIVVKLNSGTTEGTNLFTFNGSAAKTINITPSSIGAAASSHTHSYLPLSGGTLTLSSFYGLNVKRSDTNGVAISYKNSNGALGGIGFLSNGNLVISSGSNTSGDILKASTSSATFPGTVNATTFVGALSGNASSATKLDTARTIALGGDLSGSASFNGTANVTISATVTAMTTEEIDALFA